jgi:hypothetical protein
VTGRANKNHKSLWIIGEAAEILTGDLKNISQKRYRISKMSVYIRIRLKILYMHIHYSSETIQTIPVQNTLTQQTIIELLFNALQHTNN